VRGVAASYPPFLVADAFAARAGEVPETLEDRVRDLAGVNGVLAAGHLLSESFDLILIHANFLPHRRRSPHA
jgi:hypothetical protein